jgi:PAS domain S-box-containing protein
VDWRAITPPEWLQADEKAIAALGKLEAGTSYEKEYIRPDGTRVPILITLTRLPGPDEQIAAFILDITDRKLKEQELLEKEVQYRNLANAGLALIWTAGTDKLCTYFNEPWLKFTGRTLEQELGNGWTEGVHPDDLERCVNIYVRAFDQRQSFDMDYRLRHADGEYRWIRDMGTPNYDAGGEFVGYIGHCFDITEQRRTQEEIRRLNENLEKTVNERTAELKQTIAQLEETNRVFVGREMKMAELKARIAELEKTKDAAHRS